MTDPDYRDRFGNDMDWLFRVIAEAESFGIKWYRFPRAKQIAEDWPTFFKQEQRKRVNAYLIKRSKRLNAPAPLPLIDSDDLPELGLL